MSQPPPRRPAPDPSTIPQPQNQCQLAKALGISSQNLGKHRKFNKLAPKSLNVEEWRQFLAAVGREGTADNDILRQISLRKLSILATKDEKEKDELEKSRGNLLEFDLIERFLREIIGIDYAGELDRLAQELPPNLVGRTAAQMFIHIKKEKDEIKAKLLKKTHDWIEAVKAKHKTTKTKKNEHTN
jgi:hypothetical protein